jgi:two-component system NarL family response regulator
MRIMLADDQLKVRFALRVLLERQPGLKVISEAASGEELLCRLNKSCPDLLLLDWELGDPNELLPALRARCPQLLVIALSGRSEARVPALGAGVDDFVSKVDPPEQLLAAVNNCQNKMSARATKGGIKWSSLQILV